MKKSLNQNGFSHVVLLLLVLVVGVIGFASYRVATHQSANVAGTDVSNLAVKASVPDSIKSKVDASKASKALDAESIDKTLDSSQLDNDLNSVL